MSQLHQEEEFGQPVPKKLRLDYQTPPLHFPHNQNLPPPLNSHFPMSQLNREEFGQPLPKKTRLDYQAPLPMNRPQNGGLCSPFYKTRICIMFINGCCQQGDNCNYAHGQSDLRKPDPNWKEIVGNSQNGMTPMMAYTNESFGHATCFGGRDANVSTVQKMQNLNMKMKLCHRFENTGRCRYGNSCIYAHGIAELKNYRSGVESSRANVGPAPLQELPREPMSVALPIEPQITCMEEEEEEEIGEEEVANQRWPKKMNGIYGDWPSYLRLRG